MRYILLVLFFIKAIVVFSEPVNVKDAQKVALNFYYSICPDKNGVAIKAVKTKEYKGINTYYTIVFENKDWVVVSADNAAEPIFAYSTSNNYSDNHSPAYEYWMNTQYDLLVDNIRTKGISNENTIQLWNDLLNNKHTINQSKSSVDPLIDTKWGQSIPNDGVNEAAYNFEAPYSSNCQDIGGHCTAGCVAVAMGQIMNYWEKPYCPDHFDWSNMPNKLLSTSTTQQRDAIAHLLRVIGGRFPWDYYCTYGGCGSYTTQGEAKSAFVNDFGYADAEIDYRENYSNLQWRKKLREELDEGQSIFYFGYDANGGHAFVCDGYKQYLLQNADFHFNWGWNGDDDGYYKIPEHFYTTDQGAIFNIKPTIDCGSSLTVYQDYKEWVVFEPLYYTPTAGYIYTYSGDPASHVVIEDGENVHYKATNKIVLRDFTASSGSTFKAEIIPCPLSCDFNYNNKKNAADNYILGADLIEPENESNFGIEAFEIGVSIYPNPNNGNFNIDITGNDKPVKVEVSNTLGGVVLSKNITGTTQIDISNQPDGIYIVKTTIGEEVFIEKIIKQ